jgi:pyruvate/2-oxoglutarate dehydrogenase complex dihydrolipoamide dehydrogenase (E3) component
MATQQTYDAIVIGASTAAVSRLCPALAQAGWKTALIEREHVGGTCVNVGCMPTKTIVASARVAIWPAEQPTTVSLPLRSRLTWRACGNANRT